MPQKYGESFAHVCSSIFTDVGFVKIHILTRSVMMPRPRRGIAVQSWPQEVFAGTACALRPWTQSGTWPCRLISFCGRDWGNGAVFRSQRLYGKISINRRAEHISGAEPLAPLCQLPRRKFQTAEAAGQRDRCSVKGQLRLPAVPVDFRFLRTSKWAGRPCRSPGPRRRSPRRSRY